MGRRVQNGTGRGGGDWRKVVGHMNDDYLLLLYKVVLTQATLQRYLLRAGWQQARAAEQSNKPNKRIGTRTREREIASESESSESVEM